MYSGPISDRIITDQRQIPPGVWIGHRYFDFGGYPAGLISEIYCDTLMVEHDFVDRYEGVLEN